MSGPQTPEEPTPRSQAGDPDSLPVNPAEHVQRPQGEIGRGSSEHPQQHARGQEPVRGREEPTPQGEEALSPEVQQQEIVNHVYNIAFFEEAQDLIQQHGLEEKAKESLRLRLFPQEAEEAERQRVHDDFRRSADEYADLSEALDRQKAQKNEKIKREFDATTNEEVRAKLDEYGLTDRYKQALQMAEFPQDYDHTEKMAFGEALNQDIQSHQDLMESMNNMSMKAASDEADRLGAETPREPEEPVDPDETEEAKKQRINARQEELAREVERAVKAANDDPLDVDKRKKAAEAIKHAKDHAEEHDAEHYAEGDPALSKVLKGLGIALYIYIGLQYAAASAAVAYGEGSSKK